MGSPHEILVAPFQVYIAPYGESFPDVDTTPAGNWTLLGTNGKFNMSEDGVTINHEQTIVQLYALGSTFPVKAIRTQEACTVGFTLLDATLEQVKYALNNNTVTDTAAGSGTPGYRVINIRQGQDVYTHALLVKGASPYDNDLYGQYEIPSCFQSGNMSLVYNKSVAVGVAIMFTVLEDPNAASDEERAGQINWQDAVALA